MKRALLFALLAASAAGAKCKRDGVHAFPAPGAVVPTNSRFILEGVGREQARVAALVGRELYLKAKDDAAAVEVLRGWESSARRTAVVLKPKKELKPNRSYSLMVDAYLPNYSVLNPGSAETLTWNTGDSADARPPSFVTQPAISEGLYRGSGESASKFVKIGATLEEESPAYLVVTLKRARGGTGAQGYFVPIDGGEVLLGHDECSGSFSFDDGRAYRAKLEAFDVAGNGGPKLPELEFHAPTPVRR